MNSIKIFLLILSCVSILILSFDLLNIASHYQSFYKTFICISAVIFTIYYLVKNQLDQSLTFIIIGVLFNPYYPVILQRNIWIILEFPIIFLYGHRFYFIFYENKFKQIERTADKLDLYFKELERTISLMTYHQIAIYLQKRYPQNCEITPDKITWIVNEIPDIKFEILSAFYSTQNSKGGVNAIFINQFKNIQAHLNFNLTEQVKYTIKGGKGLMQPNPSARYIKHFLMRKYHYLDL
ncbi:MAG: hypothetical protein JSS07_08985 [Proteobacteria bacterium]|nr:hypothetical protein [Pseudomonadota bacterium]